MVNQRYNWKRLAVSAIIVMVLGYLLTGILTSLLSAPLVAVGLNYVDRQLRETGQPPLFDPRGPDGDLLTHLLLLYAAFNLTRFSGFYFPLLLLGLGAGLGILAETRASRSLGSLPLWIGLSVIAVSLPPVFQLLNRKPSSEPFEIALVNLALLLIVMHGAVKFFVLWWLFGAVPRWLDRWMED